MRRGAPKRSSMTTSQTARASSTSATGRVKSAGDGTIDDYAFFIWALLELYRATFDAAYLAKAVTFAHTMIRNFFDAKHGGFYLYGNESEQLISRPKEVYDGAMPSGNSVAAFVLGCLVRLTANETFAGTLDKQTAFVNETAHNNPYGFSFGLLALMNVVYPSKELVCAVSRDSDLDQLHRFSRQHPEIEMLVKTVENSALLGKRRAVYEIVSGAGARLALLPVLKPHLCRAGR